MNEMISSMINDLQTIVRVDPTDHYWVVASSSTQVYSSKSNTYVPVADAAYTAWLQTGKVATPIPTEAEIWPCQQPIKPAWLWNGTTFSQPTAATYTKAQLAAYSASARYLRRNAGVIVTSLSPVAFMSDEPSVNDVNSSYNYGQANPAATFHWKMSDGSFVTLNATQITTLHNDILNYVQSCFACESTTGTAINGGTITTLAQIDAAYAAVSNTFP